MEKLDQGVPWNNNPDEPLPTAEYFFKGVPPDFTDRISCFGIRCVRNAELANDSRFWLKHAIYQFLTSSHWPQAL